jgi:hypothetical protein
VEFGAATANCFDAVEDDFGGVVEIIDNDNVMTKIEEFDNDV